MSLSDCVSLFIGQLSLRGSSRGGSAPLLFSIGNQVVQTEIETAEPATYRVGTFEIDEPGYVEIKIAEKGSAKNFDVRLEDLLIVSEDDRLKLTFVRSNDGNLFYWGRRGPSVHLRYQVPEQKPLRYGYCEVTVPEGMDPPGSFFMACGFGEGYFGMQVNSPSERRVLFSVWSPFRTDDPSDIPPDQRIVPLARGKGVHIGEFGNEGSGGQSYQVFPWKASIRSTGIESGKPTTATSGSVARMGIGTPAVPHVSPSMRPVEVDIGSTLTAESLATASICATAVSLIRR